MYNSKYRFIISCIVLLHYSFFFVWFSSFFYLLAGLGSANANLGLGRLLFTGLVAGEKVLEHVCNIGFAALFALAGLGAIFLCDEVL